MTDALPGSEVSEGETGPEIRRVLRPEDAGLFYQVDSSYTVEAELVLDARDGEISYTIRGVTPPYVKQYVPTDDAASFIDRPSRAGWLAYIGDAIAGQVLVQENWNRFAMIWDLCVEPRFRGRGIGRRLIGTAIDWAHERDLPGVMLEAQNINVTACRLYERCGFTLRGFDTYLYRGEVPGTGEIALFWYLVF